MITVPTELSEGVNRKVREQRLPWRKMRENESD